MPCTRAIGSWIRRLAISSCSQRTWTSRVNCSDKFFPGRSTVVTARIMRTLSVVLRADVLITHKILCGLHANLLKNKYKSNSTNHPTLHLGCVFIYVNTGKQHGLMKWSSVHYSSEIGHLCIFGSAKGNQRNTAFSLKYQ